MIFSNQMKRLLNSFKYPFILVLLIALETQKS